jgi:hypothetical protein
LIGAESVVVLSTALFLVSTVPWVEGWFDGVDRAMIWHRRLAIAGVVLLVPHILIARNPNPSAVGPGLGVLGIRFGCRSLTDSFRWRRAPRRASAAQKRGHRRLESAEQSGRGGFAVNGSALPLWRRGLSGLA